MRLQFLQKGIFFSSLFIALMLMTNSCDVEEPDFSNLRGMKLIKTDGRHLEVEFTIDCDNPNKFGIKVKRSKLNVSIENEVLGVITLDEKIKIKRKSKNSYTVPASIDLENGALFRLMKYVMREEVTVKLEGKVRGSVYGFSKSIDINETRSIDGSMLNIGSGE